MSKDFAQLLFETNAEHFLRDNAQAILHAAPRGQRGVVVAAQCPDDGKVNLRWLPAKALLACCHGDDTDGMRAIAQTLLEQSYAVNLESELLVSVTVGGRWWIGVLKFEPETPKPNQLAA